MKAYHIDRFGSIGGIVRRSAEDPRPGPKEVLMRVRASSLNYRDLMVLKGGGRGPAKLGVIPLSDGAGDVEAVGEGVTRSRSVTGLPAAFMRAGMAARSSRITLRIGSAPISMACWLSTRC